MTRHLIAGRFGPGDRQQVPAADDEIQTRLDLIVAKKQMDYGISRALTDLAKLKLFPTEIGLDLLVLAAHVHAADTRISRTTESEDTWTREIRLVVPVSDSVRWNRATPVLRKTLDFLTGDRWTVGFRARPARFAEMVPKRKEDLIGPPFDGVNLFSGGLDSLIGAIDALAAGRTPLLVSHAGEGAVSRSQELCFDGLKKAYSKNAFERLRVWMSFPNSLVRNVASENTTRGRSFLFFALGIFAGTGLGRAFTLHTPENGLIALNVPLDTLRLGALSTRTTHPFYIARWNELLTIIGIPAAIENPYWNKTKGEMVAGCANAALLQELVPTSLSCASPTKGRWKGRGTEHCGYCLPCLIRRASLMSVTDATKYTVPNLRAQSWDTRRAEGEQIRSFQFAIERLRTRPHLANILIYKPGPLSDSPARIGELADVYRRGLAEVGRLLSGVRARPM